MKRRLWIFLIVMVAGTGVMRVHAGEPSRADAEKLVITSPAVLENSVIPSPAVLKPATFKHYIDEFNRSDRELHTQHIPNAQAWEFLANNVPLFECPDSQIEHIYYFRWWTYRKHLNRTSDGFVVTEFLPPVGWAGKHNTINCAAGHHLYEGRWIHDPRFLNDYSLFWFRKGGNPRSYSFWAADAMWARYLVNGDAAFVRSLLEDLVRNYEGWEKERQQPDGLFWQIDDRDGMEMGISGTGTRPTLNSYMYGDAMAIARIAELAHRSDVARTYRDKAATLRRLIEAKLWDADAKFYKVIPRGQDKPADVRELLGYTPWYVGLPGADKAVAWVQLTDPRGFAAPFGPTTAEQRQPRFAISYQGHECQWNGPSWPYATSVTLTALANLLNGEQTAITAKDYFELLKTYTRSHRLRREDGTVVPWIDENLNPHTGDWISRTRLKTWKNGTWDAGKGGEERGKDYNHSTYCDLVITGLVGLRPRADDVIEVHPLLPEGAWDYFCLDQVRYHRRWITILWDKTGQRYGRGRGLRVLVDGKEVGASPSLSRVTASLPSLPSAMSESRGGWRKHPANPVLGGKLGTCFDVALLQDGGRLRMYFSWRPRKSLALVESEDGVHWSEPVIVLAPNGKTDWEADINRPSVLKLGNRYHMWYTGQARGKSLIGYATSADGKVWARRSDKPVLSAEQAWEKEAVMCPHVLWDEERKLFRMWYSGGEQYEPDAIGYATSPDGLRWTRHERNPIFAADPHSPWEQHKVTACQVVPYDRGYAMFYIGFRDVDHAQIGIAWSKDGVSGWQRLPANPIIRPTPGQWDADACYKPFAIHDVASHRWMLWYNGRNGSVEQIGLAVHEGDDLGFGR